ncbi:MAG: RagB/SusD family nutrient uptake outer membrane protein [Bacteroides sp.]|nr:RagB/SusD family nutrient uptake outer membrane protein [Bacteroides sp.]
MKQYKYVITLLVTCQLLLTIGCSDWLHLVPEDGVSIREYWKTKEDVRSAMNGIYASMLADGTVKGIFLYGEGRADVIGEYNRTNARMLKIIEGELEADNAELDWSTFYTTINLCNTLVEYAPLAFENDNTFTQKELDQYVAQAITVRTLMYFYLVRAYGDIPFSLEPYVDSSSPFVLAKSDKEEIVKSLISHLEALNQTGNEKLPFPDAKADPAQNKCRVNVYTLKALLADLYLWNEQYEECIRQCDQILNSNMYSLIPVGREMKGGKDEEDEEDEEVEEELVYYVANESDANNLFLSLSM